MMIFHLLWFLGRVHHAVGNYRQAVQYLQQGLQIAEQLSRREDEAKIRHRLGLALWGHGDLEGAQNQLYSATELFENIRREAQISSDYKLSLFDLQTASYQALQVRTLLVLVSSYWKMVRFCKKNIYPKFKRFRLYFCDT